MKDFRSAPTPSTPLFTPRPRRAAPVHLLPPASAVAPNGLKMSRALSQLNAELIAEFDTLIASSREKFVLFINESAQQEVRSANAQAALLSALDGSRNDEEARMLRQENARQHATILALQAELARTRDDEREVVGFGRERYFRVLGRDLGTLSDELEEVSEQISAIAQIPGYDGAVLRGAAARLLNMGQDIGEFAVNAQSYSEEAVAAMH